MKKKNCLESSAEGAQEGLRGKGFNREKLFLLTRIAHQINFVFFFCEPRVKKDAPLFKYL